MGLLFSESDKAYISESASVLVDTFLKTERSLYEVSETLKRPGGLVRYRGCAHKYITRQLQNGQSQREHISNHKF